MAGFWSNFGYVLRAVVSSEAEKESSSSTTVKVRTESATMSGSGGTGSGPTAGNGTGGAGTAGGPGGGGVPPLSSTFKLLVILNFVLIILFAAALIGLAIWGDGTKTQVQNLFTTMTNLLTASAGTFVGLIGGKAA